jgi:hypothetical protein
VSENQTEPVVPQLVQEHLAYAEASIMLLECLMLVLIERKLIPMDALVEAVETAIETKKKQVKDGMHPKIATVAAGVLSKIANSVAAASHHPGA